jgi:polysaccharide biosynthesis protein PslH
MDGPPQDQLRCLFLGPLPLDHPPNGTSIRMRAMEAGLREVCHVFPLCFRDDDGSGDMPRPSNPGAWERLLSPTPSLVRCFRSRAFADRVQQMAMESDLCFCNGLQMMQYALYLPAGMPVILDNINVESDVLERLAQQRSGAKHLYWRLAAAKLRRFERWALKRADRVIAISDADHARFQALMPGVCAVTVSPGLKLEPYYRADPSCAVPGLIVFIGALNWHVNILAAQWMVQDVLPLVRERVKHATLALVGRSPGSEVCDLAEQPGVTVHADVPDVIPWLERAGVVVAPLQVGSGVQTKIVEAMAAGKAVVTTPIGAEGLDVTPGKHLSIASDARGFAEACVRMLESPEAAMKMGEQAREASRLYRYERLFKDVAVLIQELKACRDNSVL